MINGFVGVTLVVFISFFCGAKPACADSEEIKPGKAKLVIVRKSKSPPLAYKPLIEINGVPAFYLPRGYHAELDLNPGDYTIKSDWKVIHGVPDREVKVALKAGEKSVVVLSNSMSFFMIPAGGGGGVSASIGSELDEGRDIDLTNSRRLTRFHPKLAHSAVGGYVPDETPNQKYQLSLDNEKIIKDFIVGDDAEKLKLARYLLKIEYYDESIMIEFEKYILDNYLKPYEKKLDVQALAYSCRYIASSKMIEFKSTINDVSISAPNKHLRRYNKGYLEAYYGEKPTGD